MGTHCLICNGKFSLMAQSVSNVKKAHPIISIDCDWSKYR